DRARKYVAQMPIAIQGQKGSDRAFAAACALVVGFGLSIEDALPLLREYSERCEPPWSEKELQHKLEDARKKADAEPEKVGRLLGNSTSSTFITSGSPPAEEPPVVADPWPAPPDQPAFHALAGQVV